MPAGAARATGRPAWLDHAPCVMGILNVTPDSFSDGGAYADSARAAARLTAIASEGAAICDVGAESTRPGSRPVPADEQIARLSPLADALRGSPVPVSIDTTSARVAEWAIDHGAVLVNDVSAGRADPDLLPLVAERQVAVCVMHMRGEPGTMQDAPAYDDVAGEVEAFLAERIAAADAAGVARERILVDPGIGFGKTLLHNLALLGAIPRLSRLGCPVVVGVSRKRMFEALLGRRVDERMPGSIGAGLAAVAGGAAVLRVHDVGPTVDAIAAWQAVMMAR